MEKVVNKEQLSEFYKTKKVFITGHTGFKGSWLALWLARHGAVVTGYALAPPTDPSLFELAREPKQLWIVQGGNHIQAFQNQNYRDRFVAYLAEVLNAGAGSAGTNPPP